MHYCILTSKQKDSFTGGYILLTGCTYGVFLFMYTSSACNWCALGILDLKDTWFLLTQACKMSILVTRFIHWNCLSRRLEMFFMIWNLHTWNIYLLCYGLIVDQTSTCRVDTCCCSLAYHLWLGGLDFKDCFFLCLLGGRSVHWCFFKLIWATLGVTCNLFDVMHCGLWCLHLISKLCDFNCNKLFKICATVIDGFRHKFLILQEKPKVSWCKMFAVSCGYLARDTCACTAFTTHPQIRYLGRSL